MNLSRTMRNHDVLGDEQNPEVALGNMLCARFAILALVATCLNRHWVAAELNKPCTCVVCTVTGAASQVSAPDAMLGRAADELGSTQDPLHEVPAGLARYHCLLSSVAPALRPKPRSLQVFKHPIALQCYVEL